MIKKKFERVISMSNLCPQCGAPVDAGVTKCQYCGAAIPQAAPQQQPQQQYTDPQFVANTNPAINQAWPVKNKIVAAVLAILLGGLGIHKFYLGKIGEGVLMLLFCWTYIPAVIGLVEGIIMLTSTDENFQMKYQCRLK